MNVTLKGKKTLPELTAFAIYCDFLIIETFLKISLTSFSEIGLDRKMLNTVDHATLYIEIHIWQGRNYYRFFVRGWGRGGGRNFRKSTSNKCEKAGVFSAYKNKCL